MNLGTAKTLLKRYGFNDDDPLVEWLDAGMRELETSDTWEHMVLATSVLIPANTYAFQLTDFHLGTDTELIKIRTIFDQTNSNKLREVQWTEFTRDWAPTGSIATGQPEIYSLLGHVLGFISPTPAVDTTLNIACHVAGPPLTTLADGSELPGPHRFHYAYVRAAAMIALQAENEEERAQTAQAQFEALLSKLQAAEQKVTDDEPQQVVDVMGYGSS